MAAKAGAGEANVKAKATAEATAATLEEATKSAAEAKEACLCKVRDMYDAAWTAITESAEGHAEAYAKAKNMECVLAGTAAADCKVGEAPATSPKTLSSDVPAEPCTAAPTPAPTFGACEKLCCKFTIYKDANYKGEKGNYKYCSTSGKPKYFDFNNEQKKKISSFKLTGDCDHVKVYDDMDRGKKETKNDKEFTSSSNLSGDLNDDSRAVKIWPKKSHANC